MYSFVRRTNTTRATLNLDDFTQALVRRKLLTNDKYVSGIESGTEVFPGHGPARHHLVLGHHRLIRAREGGGVTPDRVPTIG